MWVLVCGSNSVGRVSASQAEGRGFESRLPLTIKSLISKGLDMRATGDPVALMSFAVSPRYPRSGAEVAGVNGESIRRTRYAAAARRDDVSAVERCDRSLTHACTAASS